MIEVTHLTEVYNRHTAVSDLCFRLEAGKIYGLLGPNGAGKSTTLNLITGCLAPTSGTVTIDGLDIYKDAKRAKAKIGYLPEIPPLYPNMTVGEYLRFTGQVRRLSRSALADRVNAAMAQTQIQDAERCLIRTLSKGYRQRIGIAQTLIGNPEVIILDEPTVGLDPKQISEIRELISRLGGQHTVVLSSHILSEVQAVCDHVLILDHGKLRASGTPESLEQQFSGKPKLTLSVRADQDTVKRILRDVPGIDTLTYTPEAHGIATVTLETDRARNEQVFLAFSQAQCPILQMQETKVSLENIFLELTDQPEQKGAKHVGDL